MYSKKDLADMVKQAQQQLAGYQLDLESAQSPTSRISWSVSTAGAGRH